MKEKTAMNRAIEMINTLKQTEGDPEYVMGYNVALGDVISVILPLLPAELKQLEDAWSSGFTSHYFIENF